MRDIANLRKADTEKLALELEGVCQHAMHALGAGCFFYPSKLYALDQADVPLCLIQFSSSEEADPRQVKCECGEWWWQYQIPHLPTLYGQVHFCQIKKPASDECLSLVKTMFNLLGEKWQLQEQFDAAGALWDEIPGMTDPIALLETTLELMEGLFDYKDAAFLVGDDDGLLTPELGRGVQWSSAQSSTLRLKTTDYSQHSSFFSPEDSDPLAEWWVRLHRSRYDSSLIKTADCRCLPFYYQSCLIGVLIMTLRSNSEEPDATLIHLAQKTISAGLQNTRLFQSMNKYTAALSTVHTVHRVMSSSKNTSSLIQATTQLAADLMQATKCSIMLVNEEAAILEPVGKVGLSEGEIGTFPLHRSDGLPGWIWINQQSLIVNYLPEDTRFQDEPAIRYPDNYYLSMPLWDVKCLGVVTISGRDSTFTAADRDILAVLAEQTVIALSNTRLIEGQKRMIRQTLESMAEELEGPSESFKGITREILDLTCELRNQMGAEEVDLDDLVYACLLREAGRLRLPASLPSGSYEEGDNPELSLRIIKGMELPEMVTSIIMHHHENWNGKGSPHGLKGESIPLGSRILGVAEAYVTLRRGRPGRPPETPEKTLGLLKRLSGVKYDPKVIEALEAVVG
jgi:HD domain/GAF domain